MFTYITYIVNMCMFMFGYTCICVCIYMLKVD